MLVPSLHTNSLISAGSCEELDDPGNGTVMVTELTDGSTANYTCNDGYQLTGDETRTCMDNGMWSGHAPTCIRTYEECQVKLTSHIGYILYLHVYALLTDFNLQLV